MWSDRYNYYNIQSDKYFTQKVATEIAVRIVLQTNSFIQKNHQSFINTEIFPWVDVIIVQTEDGNFAATDKPFSKANLIAIVCSKGNEIDQSIYKNIFLDIAEKLNWKLFLEADDDGNEGIEIRRG
jgi:uncharacterized UBP type Zn finger protein